MSPKAKGDLFLLPSPLADDPQLQNIPAGTGNSVRHIRHFICETPKSARRYLKRLGLAHELQELHFYPLNKHSDPEDIPSFLDPCLEGSDTALLSDAGTPGVADPGAEVVSMAHEKEIRVKPLVGPSSPILALMASGLNGQNFRFHGYAPREKKELKDRMKGMERDARGGESQLIMETPYRNDRLFDAFLEHVDPELRLCIALELTAEEETVTTLPIGDRRKKDRPRLHKRPAIFILGR
jgi:16S rRNA (cytidine1402-2'-O)-methyltransferase